MLRAGSGGEYSPFQDLPADGAERSGKKGSHRPEPGNFQEEAGAPLAPELSDVKAAV